MRCFHLRSCCCCGPVIPYGTGGRFFILLSLRIITIIYCISLAGLHAITGGSTSARIFFEAYHPDIVTRTVSSIAFLHFYGSIMMFLPYDFMAQKIRSFFKKKPTQKSIFGSALDYWDDYFADSGVLGRRGRFYELRLLGRELIEIPSQSYELIKMSSEVSGNGIVSFFASIIVIDCVFVPLFMGIKYVRSLRRRNVILIIDIIVDVSLGTILPALVITSPIYTFFKNPALTSDPSFAVTIVSACKYLIVTSPTDLFATTMPLILSHFLIETLHENWTDIEDEGHKVIKSVASTREAFAPQNAVVPHSKTLRRKTMLERVGKKAYARFGRAWKVLRIVLGIASISWGIAILFMLYRSRITNPCTKSQSCLLPLQPLTEFPTADCECNCLAVSVTCKDSTTSTEEAYVNQELAMVNPAYSILLKIQNCKALQQVPQQVTEFSSIIFLYLENLNVSEFTLDLTSFKTLLFFRFEGFPVTKLPDTFANLPLAMTAINIRECRGITELPSWVPNKWSRISQLRLEGLGFTEFPPALISMPQLTILSLDRNPLIQSIPVDYFSNVGTKLEILQLTNTGLTFLPENVATVANLRFLKLGQNSIESVEDIGITLDRLSVWKSDFRNLLTLTDNPVCDVVPELMTHPSACAKECSPSCSAELQNNYVCDFACNTEACAYDNGNCVFN